MSVSQSSVFLLHKDIFYWTFAKLKTIFTLQLDVLGTLYLSAIEPAAIRAF